MSLGLLLDPATLAEMRALHDAQLRHSCVVERPSTTGTGTAGNRTTTWLPVGTYACVLLTPRREARGTVNADAPSEAREVRVSFAHDTPIEMGHRLTVTHDIPGVASPLILTVGGVSARTSATRRVAYCDMTRPVKAG